MSPITGLLPGRPTEPIRPRLRRDRPDPVGRTSQIHRNPRTTADRGGLPARLGADLHRPPRPPVAAVRARQDRRQVAHDLRPIYTGVDADAAAQALAQFETNWGARYR
jgi:hypothetical protein